MIIIADNAITDLLGEGRIITVKAAIQRFTFLDDGPKYSDS
jgi:hypothetical protein